MSVRFSTVNRHVTIFVNKVVKSLIVRKDETDVRGSVKKKTYRVLYHDEIYLECKYITWILVNGWYTGGLR